MLYVVFEIQCICEKLLAQIYGTKGASKNRNQRTRSYWEDFLTVQIS